MDGPGTVRDHLEQLDCEASPHHEAWVAWSIDGWMTSSAGAYHAALDALCHHPTVGPPPGDVVRGHPRGPRPDYLEHVDTPNVGGKPHINLVCDLPSLKGIAGGLHETENGHVLTINELRAVACDCSLNRIVLGPNGGDHRCRSAAPRSSNHPETGPDRTGPSLHLEGATVTLAGATPIVEHWANGGRTRPAI